MIASDKDWIEKYIRHVELERRLSPHTAANYRRDLKSLADWCERTGIARWADLDDEHIRQFSAAIFRGGLSPKSIQRRLSAIRSFYRFMRREGHVSKNPAETVSAPKAGKRLPENLDADRMAKLLDIPGKGPIVVRDRAMLELLYSSGLRLAELAGLDTGDVDLADGTVAVIGKGGKERIVPIGRYAAEAVRNWLRERGSLAAVEEKAMFVSQRGARISRRAIQSRVKHWAKVQGIDTRVYPHLFRHSFATHLLESSHDLRGVQELLGHANISTTQVYTHLDFQHLAQIYDQTHPKARARTKE